MQEPQRILICPLDWGLGHATRCIPIIHELLRNNAEVIIAADGRPFDLLRNEFPELLFIRLKGYDINYPSTGNMVVKMLWSIPKIIKGIKKEHSALEKIIRDHRIDIVISDNRYGCWNKSVRNIFITHQLMIKSPFGENVLHRIILSHIKNFNECWIPDHETDPTLSGDLCHYYPLPSNAFFIGPLTRFDTASLQAKTEYDIMAVVSGPEPQRTLFEHLIAEQLSQSNLKAIIVRGIPEGNKKTEQKGNLTIINHLGSKEIRQAILSSRIIISRSGYSTIMDLGALNKKAIFIPTPGQTEQEYLAGYFMKKQIAYFEKQSQFDLVRALKESEKYSGFENPVEKGFLQRRINTILS
jgi:uncharacterized protein (TIGR00661 family)